MNERDAADVLRALQRAGVHIIVTHGDRLQWRCDPNCPPVAGDLFIELKRHREAIVRLLRDVPGSCRQPAICQQLGICPNQIDHAGGRSVDAADTA